jgi:selenocysteine lyase/cysteine desulfurase
VRTGEDAPAGLSTGLRAFREEVPLLGSTVYLANCSQGPLSRPVEAALAAFTDSWATLGMHWDGWVEEVERARAAFASLIGARPDDVAVGTSESQLASSVVSALVSAPGERRRRIVTSTLEFPGIGQAWEAATRYGWRVDRVERDATEPLAADDLVALVDDATTLVSFPHVVYANGSLVDAAAVAAAARDAGALSYCDAYQSLGTIPVDAEALGVDLLAGGVLKYLMGTAGIAFLYVSPRVRDRLEPTVTGWFGRVDPYAFDPTTLDYPDRASRFDLGTPPIVNAYAARAGIELVAGVGVGAIHRRIAHLSRLAFETCGELGLRVLGPGSPEAKGATTAVDAGSAAAARDAEVRLRERRVVTSARGRAVRVAHHGFTTDDELVHALHELAAILGGGPR